MIEVPLGKEPILPFQFGLFLWNATNLGLVQYVRRGDFQDHRSCDVAPYGYRRISAPLPDVRSASSVHSRPERLQSARLLIEDKALGADSAARILDATLRLTMAQRRRVERERELSNRLPRKLRDLAAKMHGEGQHLQR